jgi:hypothetical protein
MKTAVVREAIRDGERALVTLRVVREHPWRVEADGPTGRVAGEGDDLFTAVTTVREQLERDGWLLLVNAARRDAYPSPLALRMGGQSVYVLRPGEPARSADLIQTLGPLEDGRPATVAEQREHYERWRRELEPA